MKPFVKPLFLGYLIFFLVFLVGFLYLQNLSNRIEEQSVIRAYELCLTQNETRVVLTDILDRLTAPREDDEPGDLERREQLREEIDPFLELKECPPPYNDISKGEN